MKLTPEQKAFIAYGEARGILKERIDKARRDARYIFGKPYYFLSYEKKENIWFLNHLESYIKNYHQKQAACRKTCGQCVYFSPDEWGPRKDGCLKRCCGVKSNRCAVGCRYWKSRKEGE